MNLFIVRAYIHLDDEIVEVWEKIYRCKTEKQALSYMGRYVKNRVQYFNDKGVCTYAISVVNDGDINPAF